MTAGGQKLGTRKKNANSNWEFRTVQRYSTTSAGRRLLDED